MDLNKYKAIIDELVLAKNSEKDPQEKIKLENFENTLKEGFRTIEIQSRLQDLYYAGRFIEYMCLLSQYIEFEIKRIIVSSQQLSTLLGKKFINIKDLEEKTLGVLINFFNKYCIDDNNLTIKLREFNKLRRKVIHKLFDIKFEIKEIENEIDKNFNLIAYLRDIINPLGFYLYIITNKIVAIKEKNGIIPKEAKSVFEKLRKDIEELYPDLKKKDAEKNIKI